MAHQRLGAFWWAVGSFFVVFIAILAGRYALALISNGEFNSPVSGNSASALANQHAQGHMPQSIPTTSTASIPGDSSNVPTPGTTNADQARSAVVIDPNDPSPQTGENDNRPIYWDYNQFQLLKKLTPEQQPMSDRSQLVMVNNEIKSVEVIEAFIKDNAKKLKQSGGLRFVCYNAEYLEGIQGRLESWLPDSQDENWVQLNSLPEAVAPKFTTTNVFPAPELADYHTCTRLVDDWNKLMEVNDE